ncbi:NHL repeat-containing protein [Paenibacillus contaminans]|uniref:NHL repeat-containing protein n=1 Tax=Paenibacillus contaminans TaxID=450362 RepID=UPI0011BE4956|nr:NHL repeat-containing protein [Paenibacillus contaminans]
MRRFSKRSLLLLALSALAFGLWGAESAYANVPYGTFIYDLSGKEVPVQPAYVPESFLHAGFKNPEDLFIDAKDELYVADTGNNRIVHMNGRGQTIRIIRPDGEGELNEPNGLFVRPDGTMYVADTKNERIAVYDAQGTFKRSIKRPQSAILPKNFVYQPTKLVVDDRGYMYVATKNGYQGLLLLDPDGGFEGFFGANKVSFNMSDALKRVFFTKEQKQKELLKLPGTVSNVSIGPNGLLYTTSIQVNGGQIKKLNFDGKDLLGEKNYGVTKLLAGQQKQFTDVVVDPLGNITAVDAQFGILFQYNAIGELMFAFGFKDEGYQKLGLFKYPSALALDSAGKLFVLDRTANIIQTFRPTEFGSLVRKATDLHIQGHYEESAGPWREVLHMNSNYFRAHLGLAKAYYKEGDYKRAMKEFRLGGDTKGYSDAFWQVRLLWMQKHFGLLALGGAVLVAAWIAGRKLKKTMAGRKDDGSVEAAA